MSKAVLPLDARRSPVQFILALAASTMPLMGAASLAKSVTGAPVSQDGGTVLAFPGAQGFGRFATGGRGGEVVHVTTLADSGPGSLRDAVSKPHRTVVFDVGGYIKLKSILLLSSNLTIAGQTAPGEGVSTLNYETSIASQHDIIIRYMRFRQGVDNQKQEKKSCIDMTLSSGVIFDHCSIEWGRWDTVDMNACANVTLQNCIIGQGVAPQRFGCLCQSNGVTFSHDLWIDDQSRNPKAKGQIQYVDNVVYNWGVTGLVGGHSASEHQLDIINNTFIAGPHSSSRFVGEFLQSDQVYQSGNMVDMSRSGHFSPRPVTAADFEPKGRDAVRETPAAGKKHATAGNRPAVDATLAQPAADAEPPANAEPTAPGDTDDENVARYAGPTLHNASALPSPAPVDLEPALVAYQKVIDTAGDSRVRDQVDHRLVKDVQSAGLLGKIVHDPAEDGGFGEITGGPTPHYTGDSGIPDAWKQSHGLASLDLRAEETPAADGYTPLETYLNALVP